MLSEPSVTVLMPLYNCARYVREAVESILRQGWRDFELLVINDGSADEGPAIVAGIPDERIVLQHNANNMGVAATLNRGLELARGRYIARMDADDISLPDRLEQQVRFMDEHPQVGISGGWVRCFGYGVSHTIRPPCEPEKLRCYALFENPFCHMTVIMRRQAMHTHGLRYDGSFSRSEDYELWSRALRCFPLANMGRVLVEARQHQASATLSNWQEMTLQTEMIQAELLKQVGVSPTPEERSLHHQVGRGYRQDDLARLRLGEQWLLRLCSSNQRSTFADPLEFPAIAGLIWLRYCTNSAHLGPSVWKIWRNSPLNREYHAPIRDRLRLCASIIWHRFRPCRLPVQLSAGEDQRRRGNGQQSGTD